MADQFTSVQWEDGENISHSISNNTGADKTQTQPNVHSDGESINQSTPTSSSPIGNNSILNDNQREENPFGILRNSSKNTLGLENNSKELEGSGLITQTMILGSETETTQTTSHDNANEEQLKSEQASLGSIGHLNGPTKGDEYSASTSQTNETFNAVTEPLHFKLIVEVTDPVTEHEGSNTFTNYHLKVETDSKKLSSTNYTIVRRYSDFDTLFKCLSYDFPTVLIPPLPNKQRLEYIKGGRFTEEFVVKRCNSLNIFMQRVTKHEILRNSDVLMIFLENSQYWHTYKSNLNFNETNITHANSGVEGFTEFLMNSFKKPTMESKYTKNFKEIESQRIKLQENLNKIDKIYGKVINKQESISKELNGIGDEFNKLTILLNNDFNGKFREEENLDKGTKELVMQFKVFSENLKKVGGNYHDLNKYIEFNYINGLKDLEHYLISLGNLIKLKDNKIIDYEMLNNYFEKTVTEKENLENGGSLTSTTEGTISYLSRKFETLTGLKNTSPPNDPHLSTNDSTNKSLIDDRIRKLNSRIELLEKERENAKQVYTRYELDLLKEWNQFKSIKDYEIVESLGHLSDQYIKLYSESYEKWEKLQLNDTKLEMPNKLTDEGKEEYFGNNVVLQNDEEIKNMLHGVEL